MKEEIKQVINGWYYYDKAFGWAEDEDDFVDSLATRLDKAIGIEEDKVIKIIEREIFCVEGLCNITEVAQAIAKDRPLKVTVGE